MRMPVTLLQRVQKLPVRAEYPFLREGKPASAFNLLRREVELQSGVDFLGAGELLKVRGHRSSNPAIAHRSRHICGDAFDIDLGHDGYIVVDDANESDGKQYWRIYLAVADQLGNRGKNLTLFCELRREQVTARFIDFTELAESFGWRRIPAWRGWSHDGDGQHLREYWHYQLDDDLTFDEAITFLYGRQSAQRPERLPFNERVFGLNDRGKAISDLQHQLSVLDLLDKSERDGIFGVPTLNAIIKFQQLRRLPVNGLADEGTRRQLAFDVLRLSGVGL